MYYIIDKIYLWYFYKFIHKTEKEIIENIINYELKKFGSSYNQVLKEPIINGEEWYTHYTFSTKKEYLKWKRYSIKQIKALSKEEFMKIDGASEELYDNLQKSKSGFIRVEKISKNKGAIATGDVYEGHTDTFGEGVSLTIGDRFCTFRSSVIVKINKTKNTFKTLNSTYKYQFKED